MRLLLVLLALLSGLSLAEVTASSARAEVVGSTSGAFLARSQEQQASVSRAKAQHPRCEQRPETVQVFSPADDVRAISIEICDRPLE
ncbi:MAG: hypothetical protein KGQ75_09965 [Sphingomonadales bacterium]|nr:hypothetical protein [Sphingomonadales bacterium]